MIQISTYNFLHLPFSLFYLFNIYYSYKVYPVHITDFVKLFATEDNYFAITSQQQPIFTLLFLRSLSDYLQTK